MIIIKKQKGASLIIALVVLLVITILGISSVRLSSQDLIIASNEQQQMMVFQATESARKQVVNFYNVYKWIDDETTPSTLTQQINSGNVRSDITITRGAAYTCFGQAGQEGEANSIGVGTNKCRVYTFAIDSQLLGTGARAKLFKGEGKELPSTVGNGISN